MKISQRISTNKEKWKFPACYQPMSQWKCGNESMRHADEWKCQKREWKFSGKCEENEFFA